MFFLEEFYLMKNLTKLLCVFVCLFGQHIKASMSMEEAFKVLKISEDATDDQVKNAFKKAALQWHTDKWSHTSEQEQENAKTEFQKIDHAKNIILNTRAWINDNIDFLKKIVKAYWQEHANITYPTVIHYIIDNPNLENRLHLNRTLNDNDYGKDAIGTAIYKLQEQLDPQAKQQERVQREQEAEEQRQREERERIQREQEEQLQERQRQEQLHREQEDLQHRQRVEQERIRREQEELRQQQEAERLHRQHEQRERDRQEQRHQQERVNHPENKKMACQALELATSLHGI